VSRCPVPFDVLYSHAEAIQARYLLNIDAPVSMSELARGTGLVNLLHEQLVRERGGVIRSEDSAMAIERQKERY
jgi:hypothetical protein